MNRTYAEVLVEQNCNGAMDTAYVYGTARLSLDRFDGSTGYYLYDPKGSVTGLTNSDGQICRSYRYGAFGEITYGAPQYENIYAYNGESYNPNVGSLYLRARYYNVATGAFFTEDTYLGNIREPLTLNRYVYCVGNPVNYVDPSGKSVENDIMKAVMSDSSIPAGEKGSAIDVRIRYYHALQVLESPNATFEHVMQTDFNSNRNSIAIYGGSAQFFSFNALEAVETAAEVKIVTQDVEGVINLRISDALKEYGTTAIQDAISMAYMQSRIAGCSTDDVDGSYHASEAIKVFMRIEEGTKNTKIIDGVLWHFPYDTGARQGGDWTIGYGTQIDKPEKYPNGMTDEDAKKKFEEYIRETENILAEFLQDNNLVASQQQFDALVSFSYNVGNRVWKNKEYEDTREIVKNILLGQATIDELFSESMWEGPTAQQQGLVPRRERERIIFLYGLYINKDALKPEDIFLEGTE